MIAAGVVPVGGYRIGLACHGFLPGSWLPRRLRASVPMSWFVPGGIDACGAFGVHGG